MKLFVAGISGDTQYVRSTKNFYELNLNPGDIRKEFSSGRGDVSRRLACTEFMDGGCDAIAMIDMDMMHPPDMLDRLRSHDLDMVTGHYWARNARYIHSVCWEVGEGKWPYPPMLDVPKTGLKEISISGFGNVIIGREVIEAVNTYLPKGDHPFAIGPAPDITGDHSSLGTDFRFFSIARYLGYKLWLDASIESRHATIFWLDRSLAEKLITPQQTFIRMKEISDMIGEVTGPMSNTYLDQREKVIKERLKDLQEQKAQMTRNASLLDRQIVAVVGALGEVQNAKKFLAEDTHPTDPAFPVVENPDRAAEERTSIPGGYTVKDAQRARESVSRKEALAFVHDYQEIINEEPGVSENPA